MVIKERLLIEIEAIQRSSNVLKKCMFLKKDYSGMAVSGSFLNHALLNRLIHVADDLFDEEIDVGDKDIVLCKIVELIFCAMLHDLRVVVKPGQLYPMKKVYGINWKGNVNTTWHVIEVSDDKYVCFGTLVEVVNRYLGTLKRVNQEEDDWLGTECISCLELLTSGPIGMTSCG